MVSIAPHQLLFTDAIPRNAVAGGTRMCSLLGAAVALAGIDRAVMAAPDLSVDSAELRASLEAAGISPQLPLATLVGLPTSLAIAGNLPGHLADALRLIGVVSHEGGGGSRHTLLREFLKPPYDSVPYTVALPLPAEGSTVQQGFTVALLAIVRSLAMRGRRRKHVNMLPGLVAPEDAVWLRAVLTAFNLAATLLPDYDAGTPIGEIIRMGGARATVELGRIRTSDISPGRWLREEYRVPIHRLPLPIGLGNTDKLFHVLAKLSSHTIPKPYRQERQQVAAVTDECQREMHGVPVAVSGDGEYVVALASCLHELGFDPVLCITRGPLLETAEAIRLNTPGMDLAPQLIDEGDVRRLFQTLKRKDPQLLVGGGVGEEIAQRLQIPVVRAGFPHTAGTTYFGYAGSLRLVEAIREALEVEAK